MSSLGIWWGPAVIVSVLAGADIVLDLTMGEDSKYHRAYRRARAYYGGTNEAE